MNDTLFTEDDLQQIVDTVSEGYRHACEVRHVAKLDSKEDRRRYLEGVRRVRGDKARERIIQSLREMQEEK